MSIGEEINMSSKVLPILQSPNASKTLQQALFPEDFKRMEGDEVTEVDSWLYTGGISGDTGG